MGVILEKVGSNWVVYYRDLNGNKKEQWFATKKEADWFYKWKERDSDRSGYGAT